EGFVSLRDTVKVDGVRPQFSTLHPIDQDTFWLGTYDAGLLEYRVSTGEVRQAGGQVTAQCDSVVFVASTVNYDIAGCLHSLVRQHKTTRKMDVLTTLDGLFDREFNEGAVFFHPEEGLYLGTPYGMTLVDLDQHRHSGEMVRGVIESVSSYDDDGEYLSIRPAQMGRLGPGLDTLVFQLTAEDFIEGYPHRFRYRLSHEGRPLSRGLIDLGEQSQIWLTQPPLGRLSLEVQAGTSGGVWGPVRSYGFTVERYWWETRWFRMLLVLLALSAMLAFMLSRQRKLAHERAINQALRDSEQRLDIALVASGSSVWDWYSDSAGSDPDPHLPELVTAGTRGGHEVTLAVSDKGRFTHNWVRLLRGYAESIEGEYRVVNPDGRLGWYRISGRPIEYDQQTGEVSRVAGIASDISDQRAIKAKIEQLARAIESSADGSLMLDEEERIVSSNSAAQNILHYTGEELQGTLFARLIGGGSDNEEEPLRALGEDGWSGEISLLRSSGGLCPVWLSVSRVFDALECLNLYVVTFSDLSERRAAQAQLLKLSKFDSLTGLPNRHYFTELLDSSIANAKHRKLALVFFGVDRLDTINEVYGYGTGDQILVRLAKRLQLAASDVNAVGQFSISEFLILL
ncbi:MAG: diguanylate cyclase domain-containing protein, partial [Parahaliea sp.]